MSLRVLLHIRHVLEMPWQPLSLHCGHLQSLVFSLCWQVPVRLAQTGRLGYLLGLQVQPDQQIGLQGIL